jgi:3-phosphoshikimate 1-carboxyvinyltransferase
VEDIATTAKTMPDFPQLWADMLAQEGPAGTGLEGSTGGAKH